MRGTQETVQLHYKPYLGFLGWFLGGLPELGCMALELIPALCSKEKNLTIEMYTYIYPHIIFVIPFLLPKITHSVWEVT